MEKNQRVESTVQNHKATADPVTNVDAVVPLATYSVLGQDSGPQVQVLEHVVGDVAHREEKNQDEQQPQAFLFQFRISGVCAAQDDNHMSIAAQYDEEWDAKSSERPSKVVLQIISHSVFTGGVEAFPSVVVKMFVKENVRKALSTHQQPDHK